MCICTYDFYKLPLLSKCLYQTYYQAIAFTFSSCEVFFPLLSVFIIQIILLLCVSLHRSKCAGHKIILNLFDKLNIMTKKLRR